MSTIWISVIIIMCLDKTLPWDKQRVRPLKLLVNTRPIHLALYLPPPPPSPVPVMWTQTELHSRRQSSQVVGRQVIVERVLRNPAPAHRNPATNRKLARVSPPQTATTRPSMAQPDFSVQCPPAKVSRPSPTQAKAHQCPADIYRAAKHSTSTTIAKNASTSGKQTCVDSCQSWTCVNFLVL